MWGEGITGIQNLYMHSFITFQGYRGRSVQTCRSRGRRRLTLCLHHGCQVDLFSFFFGVPTVHGAPWMSARSFLINLTLLTLCRPRLQQHLEKCKLLSLNNHQSLVLRASIDGDGDGDISKEEFVKNAMGSKFINDILNKPSN